ncbi:DUF2169 family type VI secretion system accessory protein [Paracoccus caeni]|nr:DUF2169 domain-containing protein [Paracoccus caeni]
MRIINNTVFPAIAFDHWDGVGQEQTVVVIKATFRRDGELWSWTGDQSDFLFEDRFDGDPAFDPLLAEQDIAPEKPGTDLILHAVAYVPADGPRPDWPVEVVVPGRLKYGFHVRGPSCWYRSFFRGWRLAEPEPVHQVAIDYRLAYGGSATLADGSSILNEFNPAGCGFVSEDLRRDKDPIAAPQIGKLEDFWRGDVYAPMEVHGFGPVARTWLPRRGLAGTYDDDWLSRRHPQLPEDFDQRYWNAAPKPLQISQYLSGNEELHLRNLHPTRPLYRLGLPGVVPHGTVGPSGISANFRLDTVILDISSPDDAMHVLTLVWRARFPSSDLHDALEIGIIESPG